MGYDQKPPVRPDSAGAQIPSNRGHASAQHPPTAFAAAGSQASAVLDVQTAAVMLLQYPQYLHAQFIAAWMQQHGNGFVQKVLVAWQHGRQAAQAAEHPTQTPAPTATAPTSVVPHTAAPTLAAMNGESHRERSDLRGAAGQASQQAAGEQALTALLAATHGTPATPALVELLAAFPDERLALFAQVQAVLGPQALHRVLQAERLSEGLAAADGRRDHGRVSRPAHQQRRRGDQSAARVAIGAPGQSEPAYSAAQGEAAALTASQVDLVAEAADAAATQFEQQVAALATHLEDLSAKDDDAWRVRIIETFTELDPQARMVLQRHLDMRQVLGRLSDWEACRLGVVMPLADRAAQQWLNHKRAMFLVRTLRDYGPAHTDVLAAYVWQGVYAADAREILALVAEAHLVDRFTELPHVAAALTAQGIDARAIHNQPQTKWDFVHGMGRGIERLVDHALDNQMYGDANLRQWHRDLPPAYRAAMESVDDQSRTAQLAPSALARGVFDHVTFGLPGGVYDLTATTVRAGGAAARGDYAAAGEQLTPAMLAILSHLGVKVWQRRAMPAPAANAPASAASAATPAANAPAAAPTASVPAANTHTTGAQPPAAAAPTAGASAASTEPAGASAASTEPAGASLASAEAASAGATVAEASAAIEMTAEARAARDRLLNEVGQTGLDIAARALAEHPSAAALAAEFGEAGIAALARANGDPTVAARELARRAQQLAAGSGGAAVKSAASADEAAHALSTAQGAALADELAELAALAPDTSRDAYYIAQTDHALAQQYKFDWQHVLQGEIGTNGKATGFHAEFAAEGASRITPGATVTPQPNGTYKAEVQVFKRTSKQWKKKGESTFFPRHWSRARIEFEVIEAFKKRHPVPNEPAKWRGDSPSGLEIEGFERPDRTTFYPTGNGVVTE